MASDVEYLQAQMEREADRIVASLAVVAARLARIDDVLHKQPAKPLSGEAQAALVEFGEIEDVLRGV